jgi:hypothetical protein
MRGGTSKGVFFNLTDLPEAAQVAGAARDALLLRVIGSPDPYGKQTDGMGGATSSTSKTVILSRSSEPDHDVDYLFGQVSIDKPFVDWSGNCGNLTAAVGSFAIMSGLVDAERIPRDGTAVVRRRFRTRRRNLPGRRGADRIHRSRRRRGRDLSHREPGRRTRGSGCRQAAGHHDQCRYPDNFPERRGHWLQGHRAAA